MGFEERHQKKQQQQRQQPAQPAPLSRTTENRAATRPAAPLGFSQRFMMDKKELKLAAGAASALAPGSTSSTGRDGGGDTKRRLRPMELKRQQRLQRDQRKRAKLSSSSSFSAAEAPAETPTAVPPPQELGAFGSPSAAVAAASEHENGGNGGLAGAVAAAAAAPVAFRDSRGGSPNTTVAGRQAGSGREPLRRSSSSPPSIGSARGYDDPHGDFSRRNAATPPKGHPVDFIGGIVEESRHPAEPSSPRSVKDRAGVVEGLPGFRNSSGGGENDGAVVAHESRSSGASSSSGGAEVRAAAGEGRDGGNSGESGNTGVIAAAPSPRQTGSENTSAGASRSGGGRGGAGGRGSASLFDMVMSGASSSSQSSNAGGGGGGSGRGDIGGRNRLAIAATTGARAEGGKPATSTLSGILGGMRGGQAGPADSSKGSDSDRGIGAGIGVGGGGGGGGGLGDDCNEDWMAINLEKLSNFRVPETRMGFPDGAREGLRRSATAPSRSSISSREQPGARGRRGAGEGHGAATAASAGAEKTGEPRWQFDCPHPFGGTHAAASVVCENTGSLLAPGPAPAKPDLPLRTRVRFEMAPGVPVPRGIGKLPGALEFRALRAFAAGGGTTEARQHRQPQRDGEKDERHCQRRPSRRRPRARQQQQQPQQVLGSGQGGVGGGSGAAQGNLAAVAAAAAKELRRRQEGDAAMELWRKATLYWQHPATPLPQEALAAQKAAQARVAKNPMLTTKAQDHGSRPGGSAASGWTSFFWSRRRDWEQAFGSLYYGLLSKKDCGGGGGDGGHTDVGEGEGEGFYLQCPLYTVLWRLVRESGGARSGGTGGRLVPAAAMTRSTRRLRKRLAAAGIEFDMPLDPAGDQRDAQADEDVLEEWKAMDVTGNAKPGAVYTNEEDRSRPHLSLLTFRGHMAVHGLFDFLLETCGHPTGGGGVSGGAGRGVGAGGGGGGGGRDFPLLLSREPFLNASLKALKVRQNGPMHRSRGTASKAGQDSAVEVLELVGHILPSALADLALAMASACTVGGANDNSDAGSSGGGGTDDDTDGDTEEDEDDDEGEDDGGRRRRAGRARQIAAEAGGGAAPACTALNDDSGSDGDQDGGNARGGDGASSRAGARVSNLAGPGSGEGREAEDEEGTPLQLFRMMGTVDADTAYLNAGFRSLGVGGDPSLPERQEEEGGEEQQEEEKDAGRGLGGMAKLAREEVGRQKQSRGSAAQTSSYCKETRARVSTSPASSSSPFASAGEGRQGRGRRERRQRRRHRSVVFDVCSVDPGGVVTDHVF